MKESENIHHCQRLRPLVVLQRLRQRMRVWMFEPLWLDLRSRERFEKIAKLN